MFHTLRSIRVNGDSKTMTVRSNDVARGSHVMFGDTVPKSSNSHKECTDNPLDHVTRPLEFNAENGENHGPLTCDVREMAT